MSQATTQEQIIEQLEENNKNLNSRVETLESKLDRLVKIFEKDVNNLNLLTNAVKNIANKI
jgi:chaperonin cofactor prefoldin